MCKWKKAVLVLLLLMPPGLARATAQPPDYLVYEG